LKLNDPELVRAEYEDETRLALRQAAHQSGEGPNALDVLVGAVAEGAPERILDVGCGQGGLAQRMAREVGVEVVAVDQSPRMVELTREHGIEAQVGDVQALDFGDASFDYVVAAWMLFHVPDLNRGLSEIARVLKPEGRLVAATNGVDHLQELHELLGAKPASSEFSAENGELALLRHFARVERRDARGHLVFPTRAEAQAYVDAALSVEGTLPPIDGPIHVRRTPVIFIAAKS
jgi:SAM-dependent methyltransferase